MGNACACTKAKSKRPNISMPNHSKAGEHNALLDRLGTAQVKLLQEKFKGIQSNGGLDPKGFKSMLPLISQLPKPVANNSFQMFDIDGLEKISWQNFCVTISQYILGRREDKCRFIFQIFDISHKGYLQGKDLQLLQRHCADAIRFGTSASSSDYTNIFDYHLREGKPMRFEEFRD